jgi:hypothetical protein
MTKEYHTEIGTKQADFILDRATQYMGLVRMWRSACIDRTATRVMMMAVEKEYIARGGLIHLQPEAQKRAL